MCSCRNKIVKILILLFFNRNLEPHEKYTWNRSQANPKTSGPNSGHIQYDKSVYDVEGLLRSPWRWEVEIALVESRTAKRDNSWWCTSTEASEKEVPPLFMWLEISQKFCGAIMKMPASDRIDDAISRTTNSLQWFPSYRFKWWR